MLPMDANMPSECNDSMMFHFAGRTTGRGSGCPSTRTGRQADRTGLYGRTSASSRSCSGKGPRGQWTCKSPGFIGDLAAIVETYPDARLVWTHRDPATTIVSLSSLVASLQNALLGEYPDLHQMGAETRTSGCRISSEGSRRGTTPPSRARSSTSRTASSSATRRERSRSCTTTGASSSRTSTGQRIDQLEEEQPTSHFAQHRYSAEDFGVDPASVREELEEYYAEFGGLC